MSDKPTANKLWAAYQKAVRAQHIKHTKTLTAITERYQRGMAKLEKPVKVKAEPKRKAKPDVSRGRS